MSSPSRLALLLSIITASVACSSGSDTALVFNFSSDPNVTNVTRINVTATRSSGPAFSGTFTAQSPDGGPMTAFYERVTLANWEGHVHVAAEGVTADQSPGGSASSDVDVDKGTAIAVFLNLALPGAGTDAGAGAGDATEDRTADAPAPTDGAGAE